MGRHPMVSGFWGGILGFRWGAEALQTLFLAPQVGHRSHGLPTTGTVEWPAKPGVYCEESTFFIAELAVRYPYLRKWLEQPEHAPTAGAKSCAQEGWWLAPLPSE